MILDDLKEDKRVNKSWKTTSTILHYGMLGFFIISIFSKSNDRMKLAQSSSNIYTWIAFCFLISAIIIYLIHWIKPSLFFDKNLKINQEKEMNNQSF